MGGGGTDAGRGRRGDGGVHKWARIGANGGGEGSDPGGEAGVEGEGELLHGDFRDLLEKGALSTVISARGGVFVSRRSTLSGWEKRMRGSTLERELGKLRAF